jgi:hypothetical protein
MTLFLTWAYTLSLTLTISRQRSAVSRRIPELTTLSFCLKSGLYSLVR